jgi:hypothetical protein
MNHRIERAAWLEERLVDVMRRPEDGARPVDALLFLDLLARLEALPAKELSAVDGLPALVAHARTVRDAHVGELGKLAGWGLDLEHFLEVGRDLPLEDVSCERDGWLRDALLVSTVLPWLTRPRAMVARAALERACALIEAEPEAFLAASRLAQDRDEHEHPAGLGEDARRFLALLRDLPLQVLFDRMPAERDEAKLRAVLARVGQDALDEAADALADHEARLRLPARRDPELLRFFADDAVKRVVCRMQTGAWVLRERIGACTLAWQPDENFLEEAGDVGVELCFDDRVESLATDADGAFELPSAPEALQLRLRVGPDTRTLTLRPGEA